MRNIFPLPEDCDWGFGALPLASDLGKNGAKIQITMPMVPM